MGISYSPIETRAHALLLAVEGNDRIHIPVVIGSQESQAIAVRIEGVRLDRPMTADLFCSFAQAFGVRTVEIFIYKFEDGIYSSEITFSDGNRTVVLDSRTSDAIAIAMRTGAPIYTTQAIVDEVGIEIIEGGMADADSDSESVTADTEENLSLEELRARLATLIENEDYEEAGRISEIIKRREADEK